MELLRGAPAAVRFPEPDGDPFKFEDAPEVTVTRDSDGSVVAKGKAEEIKVGEDSPYWKFFLSADDLAEVDLLTASWVGKLDGGATATFETEAEVVGGFVVSLPEVKGKVGAGDPSEDDLRSKREIALREIEDACGVAFRARYAKERLDGRGGQRLLLRNQGLLRVIAVNVGGAELSKEELEALTLDDKGILIREAGWSCGKGNVVVTYAYGLTHYPGAKEPISDYAGYLLTPHTTDVAQRATSMTNEAGTFSLVTPGVRGARFPLPSVNAFVNRFGAPLVA